MAFDCNTRRCDFTGFHDLALFQPVRLTVLLNRSVRQIEINCSFKIPLTSEKFTFKVLRSFSALSNLRVER